MRVFIDTNLWAYRLDRREPAKSERLRAVASRKLQPPLPAAEIATLLEALSGFEVVNTDANLVLDAHLLAERERLSWFDALIAEAAIRSHCVVLFSEDFSHGRRIGGLEVVNPLRG